MELTRTGGDLNAGRFTLTTSPASMRPLQTAPEWGLRKPPSGFCGGLDGRFRQMHKGSTAKLILGDGHVHVRFGRKVLYGQF